MALVLSASLDQAETARAVESGAAGVLHKSVELDEVVHAVRRVRAGETLLSVEEVVKLLRFASSRRKHEYESRQAIAQLTPREREVLASARRGPRRPRDSQAASYKHSDRAQPYGEHPCQARGALPAPGARVRPASQCGERTLSTVPSSQTRGGRASCSQPGNEESFV